MRISPKSWHYRLYVFMSQWNAAWRDKDDYLSYPKHGEMIGLCPYMRMILIWGPLAILSNLIPLGFVIMALLLFPMSAAGPSGIGWLLFWLVMTIGLVIGGGFIKDWLDRRADEKENSQIPGWDYEPKKKPDGFFKLLNEWIHSKFCPVLEVQND
jgi:hypothetical protein